MPEINKPADEAFGESETRVAKGFSEQVKYYNTLCIEYPNGEIIWCHDLICSGHKTIEGAQRCVGESEEELSTWIKHQEAKAKSLLKNLGSDTSRVGKYHAIIVRQSTTLVELTRLR